MTEIGYYSPLTLNYSGVLVSHEIKAGEAHFHLAQIFPDFPKVESFRKLDMHFDTIDEGYIHPYIFIGNGEELSGEDLLNMLAIHDRLVIVARNSTYQFYHRKFFGDGQHCIRHCEIMNGSHQELQANREKLSLTLTLNMDMVPKGEHFSYHRFKR